MEVDSRTSKEAMEQYEKVRELGPTNMFDYYRVIEVADKLGLHALASLTRDDYIYLLQNFGRLMSSYGITQK